MSNPAELNPNDTPQPDIEQTANTNIDTPPPADDWKGNQDYYQSGQKAGTLKPRARAKAGQVAPAKELGGLDIESLRSTERVEGTKQDPAPVDKKTAKQEKKIVEAKVAAKLVMRALDLVTGWISGGTYGADFTDKQAKDRNKYREELEADWQDYLMTLDIPMHPALVCILGSVFYVAPAMETVKGKERVQSFKEKIVSKIAVGLFKKVSS